MKIPQRKAVSPIIATLLLIAITVAAGVVVYVFVGGLSSSLSKSGGNQVTEQLSLDAYTSAAAPNSTFFITVRDTGGAAITISSVYFDGVAMTQKGTSSLSVNPASTLSLSLATSFSSNVATAVPHFQVVPASLTGGSSHQVKVVTLDGAIFTFNVIAGSSG